MAFVILPNLTCSTRSKGCFSSLIRGAGSQAGFLRRRQTTCGGFSLTFKSRARYHAGTEPGVSASALTLGLWESHHFSSPLFFFFLTRLSCTYFLAAVTRSEMNWVCPSFISTWPESDLDSTFFVNPVELGNICQSLSTSTSSINQLYQPAVRWWVSLCIFNMCCLIVFFFFFC